MVGCCSISDFFGKENYYWTERKLISQISKFKVFFMQFFTVPDSFILLHRYLMATPTPTGLIGSLLDHVLLNPILWIKTPLHLQANLLSLFATGYVGGLDYAGYIRNEVGVPRLMLMLRKYYSLKPSTSNPAGMLKGDANGPYSHFRLKTRFWGQNAET